VAIAPHAPQPDDDGVYCRACPMPVRNATVHTASPVRAWIAPVGTAPSPDMTGWISLGVTTDPVGQGVTPAVPRQYTPAAVALDAPVTSATAAAAVEPRRGRLRAAILDLLARHPQGLTDDQLEVLLGESHQTVSSARNALMRDGEIRKATDDNDRTITRPTRTGRPATVWFKRRTT
jgi:hypothetical protein